MYDHHAIVQSIGAIISMVILIGLIYAVKAIVRGTNKIKEKVKEKAGLLKEELEKVDQLIARLSYSEDLQMGKVETIYFHLSSNDEYLFYAIPPKYIKRLKAKLEQIAQSEPDTEYSYGRQYAERQFWIGNQLIFAWQNEINV